MFMFCYHFDCDNDCDHKDYDDNFLLESTALHIGEFKNCDDIVMSRNDLIQRIRTLCDQMLKIDSDSDTFDFDTNLACVSIQSFCHLLKEMKKSKFVHIRYLEI